MFSTEFFTDAPRSHPLVLCPNCGGNHYESNRFDEAEALYHEAARDVPLLLFDGKRKEAREILIALYAVHIANTLRPEHFCLSCGVTFNG